MPKSVVIVESVAKTKTIKKFLGRNYQVLPSVGHIKDLPKQKLGIDIDDGFQPQYITIRGKGKILNELKKAAANADQVFLATDPDREGEAIAWHIYEELKKKNPNIHRILFNEITEHAVVEAINHPLTISTQKVEAQKARRVLDRLVGYQISPILWQTIYRGLSAGRVQSVALRMIVEREREIQAFVPEEYWTIAARIQGKSSEPFLSNLIAIEKKKPKIVNEKQAKGIVADLETKTFAVKSIKKKKVTRKPYAPFTTSTMQQEAAKRLGYTSRRIMAIAQQLYEGIELGAEGSVGLITYMRTDSVRIAGEAVAAARDYISKSYGTEYVPPKPRFYKLKKGAQDAHEAIRPTSMKLVPKKIKRYLTKEQFKLYELIWNRFLASQMSDAVLDQTTIDIKAGQLSQNDISEDYLFRTTGSVIVFRGFLQAFDDFEEKAEKDGKENNGKIPITKIPKDLTINEKLALLDLFPKQHFTKPPARYAESSLVKELDNQGIGRPSTYALIISTLLARKYIERNARQLVPTELGFTVCDILVKNFPAIFNTKFTAEMENELDRIEAAEKDYLTVIRDFYQPFEKALAEVKSKKDDIRDSLIEDTDEKCPQCGKPLIVRWGRNGKFIGCSGYPDCRYTKPIDENEIVTTDEICEKCGRPMVVKNGRYGRFLACSGYPECNNVKSFTIGVPCPKEGCDGMIVERRSRRGKIFYGCNRYPKCDFATWYKPIAKQCENCGSPYLEERYNKSIGNYLYCPKCKTKYEQSS
ncbi:MAG: type I DNA topoisomerase [Calditrichaeota bacterium]|nr:type I DNA topoisomerase [Calditrichota bacterium]